METPYKRFYLDFDSSYRNRTLWPEPGEFGVAISRSCPVNKYTALDPVSKATPIVSWTSNLFDSTVSGPSVTVTVGPPLLQFANSNNVYTLQAPAGVFQENYNYYRHAVLVDNTDPAKRSRILEYKYLGSDRAQVTIGTDLSLAVGTSVSIFDPTSLAFLSNSYIFVPTGSSGTDDYFGQIIYNETLDEYRTIVGYDNITGLLEIGSPTLVGWSITDNYSIREQIPFAFTSAGVGSTANTVVILGASTSARTYVGQFVRIVPAQYNSAIPAPGGETRRIVAYDGNTLTATVYPPFSTTVPAASKIEILSFSYDNTGSFVYKGTYENEPNIYAIRLKSLSLPNRPLVAGNGGKIAYYPYVYVELTPVDMPSNNMIMSNNPNAINMMFKASLNNIQNPDDATFTHLNGDDMTQVFMFKVDTSFKVRVILPGGETFRTVDAERFSPAPPNPIAQISMLFELTRG